MTRDILQREIERCDDMRKTIDNRCEQDFLAPRTLCNLKGKEIGELKEILGNYRQLLMTMKENVK